MKHSADQETRSIRVIEAFDDVTIKIIYQEKEQDEWFNCESYEEDGSKKIIKLVSQDDGSQQIEFYDPIEHIYSIAANGEDSIQFQSPYFGQNYLIGASINENKGSLTWHAFMLDNRKRPEHRTYTIAIQPTYLIDYPIMCHLK